MIYYLKGDLLDLKKTFSEVTIFTQKMALALLHLRSHLIKAFKNCPPTHTPTHTHRHTQQQQKHTLLSDQFSTNNTDQVLQKSIFEKNISKKIYL